jgi:DHA1 family tetracycline resistance protein-like MFS transporter
MNRLRTVFARRQVWVTCAFIFMVDLVMGMLLPSFSLYARSLGAPLTLIGMFGTSIGLTRILSSLPMGMASDVKGRKRILSTGTLLLATAAFLHAVVRRPHLLLPARALVGLGMTATFPIGAAYLGDIVSSNERSLAIGLYYASMGLGFALGPAIGGTVATAYGYPASYRLAALLALVGFTVGAVGLTGHGSDHSVKTSNLSGKSVPVAFGERLGFLKGRSDILAAGAANLLVAAAFHGAVVSFLPLRVASLSITDEVFGFLFSIRTLVSTLSRLPAGFLNQRLSSRYVIIGTLVLLGVALTSTSYAASLPSLIACMLGEGVAYGVFVTSGQDFVVERSMDADRGAIVGLYETLGSVGSMLGPFALGLVADSWGLGPVFRLTAVFLFVGTVIIFYVSRG